MQGVELIPLQVLLGNPRYTSPAIAPDASAVAFIAPDAHDVLNVFVRPLGGGDASGSAADRQVGAQ